MSDTTDDSEKGSQDDREPAIRMGGQWVPAHLVWKKMEIAVAAAEIIDRFNTDFPDLATDNTRDVVPCVRQRLKDIELRIPKADEQAALADRAVNLLATMSPEEAIDALEEQGIKVDQAALIRLVGEGPYREALQRDAVELSQNGITAEQTARLWIELGRPTLHGGVWCASDIEDLIKASSN